MLEIDTIIQGDSLSVLKTFPNESIDCCMTSPPYWSLRDYGLEPLIWDGDPECSHDWTIFADGAGKNNDKTAGIIQRGNKGSVGRDDRPQSQFCSLCGAWRGSLGLEPTFELFLKHLCDIFDEVKRVLKKSGSIWVNLGDCYASGIKGDNRTPEQLALKSGLNKGNGVKPYEKAVNNKFNPLKFDCNLQPKSLCLIPFRFAIEMENRGWICRNVIVWHKPNCMPSSAKDRFTVDFEYLFFFTKSQRYYFEQQFEEHKRDWQNEDWAKVKHKSYSPKYEQMADRCRDNRLPMSEYYNKLGRNKRSVWAISTKSYKEAHFATYPEELCETPIKAGCPEGGLVLDPFAGAGTTCLVAKKLNRHYIGIEPNPEYVKMAENRIANYQDKPKRLRIPREIQPELALSLAGG